MREFFRGWKRKAGGVTLVMACAIFVVWMRSIMITDSLWIQTGKQFHQVHSCRGFFMWETRDSTAAPKWKWYSYPSQSWEDVGSLTTIVRVDRSGGTKLAVIAYWPFTVILSALSAWLLLWPPRKPPTPARDPHN